MERLRRFLTGNAPVTALPSPVSLPVVASTPFRATGDVSLAVWRQIFGEVQSPILDVEACHRAVNGMSVLALAMAIKESTLGRTTVSQSNCNALMMLGPNGMPMQFATWADGFKEWFRRMTDLSYKGGVYVRPDANMTLEAMIVTYMAGPACLSSAGKTCSNGEMWTPGGAATTGSVNLYLAQTLERVNRFRCIPEPAPQPAPLPVGGLAFGRVPKPAWVDRLIPDNHNMAWDNLGQRQQRGIVYHRQVGTNWGTDGWFRMIWQPNGQPGGGQMGLTDFGVDHRTGEILRWNDQVGKGYPALNVSANRSGWASGPWQNPPGDGRAFVAKYGVNAINRDLVSIEIAGQYWEALSGPGFEAICRLSAYLADQAKVPWTSYPLNPATGLTFTYEHGEFQNNKPCCGDVVRGQLPAITGQTQTILRYYQQGGA